jgi:hypothetical protein
VQTESERGTAITLKCTTENETEVKMGKTLLENVRQEGREVTGRELD